MGIGQAAVDGTPACPPVNAFKNTAIGPCIDGVGVYGVNGQDSNVGISQAAGTPAYSPIGALKHPVTISPCIDGAWG